MEKQELLKRLKENKEVCVPFSMFGDNNIEKLDVMIMVAEKDKTENWCYDNIADELLDSALCVFECLSGECDIEDILFPIKK